MLVRTDRDRCIGAGRCVVASPEVFDQDEDDGMVVLLRDRPLLKSEDGVRRAVDGCPARAIEIAEE